MKKLTKKELEIIKEKETIKSRRAKRNFFIVLDIIIIFAFILSILSIYYGEYTSGLLLLGSGTILLLYFILRKAVRKYNKSH